MLNKSRKDKKKYTLEEMSEWILENWEGLLPILLEVKESEEERKLRKQNFIESTKRFRARHIIK